MDARMARLAALDRGVHFIPMSDVVPPGDRTYHAVDLIHPRPRAATPSAAASPSSSAKAARAEINVVPEASAGCLPTPHPLFLWP